MSRSRRSTLRTVYLYGDGHGVEVHEETHPKSGKRVEWVEIYEKWGPRVTLRASETGVADSYFGQGRLILGAGYKGNGLVGLCRRATGISCSLASVKRGSDKTRALGLAYGTLDINSRDGELSIGSFPDVISSDWTYQSESCFTEKWADLEGKEEWSIYRIARRFPAKIKVLS